GDPDLTRLIQNKKVVYNNYDNIPHSYNHNSSMTGGFDYEPGRGGDIVVLSGTTLTLSGNEDKIAFIGNVQDVLSGTILDGGDEYEPILAINPTDNTGIILLVDTFIRGDVGGITGIVSDIPPGTTSGTGIVDEGGGGEESGLACNLTQTEIDLLNSYVTSDDLDPLDSIIEGSELTPVSADDWCNTVVEIDWYGGPSIPTGIWKLTNLEGLRLSYNSLETIPNELGNLTGLKSLTLNDNQLNSLPSSIGNLTNLEGLYISNNMITSLPTEIGNLTYLVNLISSNNNLSSLPSSFGNLVNLSNLRLNDNSLTILPDEMGNLTKLLTLNLMNNESIGYISEYFDASSYETTQENITPSGASITISGNGESYVIITVDAPLAPCMSEVELEEFKTYMPDSIAIYTEVDGVRLDVEEATMTNICKAIRINWFGGSSLPSELWNLPILEELGLSYNGLTTLPSGIGNLTSLRILGLEGNEFVSLPSTIGNLTNLEKLRLSSNTSLTSLPTEVGNLTNLYELLLDYNAITTLPSTIGNLTNLGRLSVPGNGLTTLPSGLVNLTNLEYIILYDNPSLGNLNTEFYSRMANSASQSGIPGVGQTMTISSNGSSISITVTP
ncbi:MAG: hypothetical protein PHN31_05885, partial [Candidatus Gracilibacteria bacterium]|nr:hypothetical protein [Candidatus Gracilibacteria bacterium]